MKWISCVFRWLFLLNASVRVGDTKKLTWLRRSITLRYIVIIALFIFHWLGIQFDLKGIQIALIVALVFNVLSSLICRNNDLPRPWLLLSHVMDIIVITLIFGGRGWLFSVLAVIWNYCTWALYTEERLAIYMTSRGVDKITQIAILTAANAVLIALEIVIYTLFLHWKFLRRFQRPWMKRLALKAIRFIARGKTLTRWDLILFSFTPSCQKGGTLAFSLRPKRFGWMGYLALVFGGFLRVMIYPFLGNWMWGVIVILIIIRVYKWWRNNDKKMFQPKKPY